MKPTEIQVEIKSFLDAEGRLKSYPAKRRVKMLSLLYLASKFESGRTYSEKEVNELLKRWHIFGDWSMLRRDLCDARLLGREADGRVYWLENTPPSPDDPGIV